MTVSTTTRFSLSRWSSDSDSFARNQIDEAHENIEFFLAKMLYGVSVPSVGLAAYAKTIFLNNSNNRIYYYTALDDSGEWIYIETDVIPSTIANSKGDVIVAQGPNNWGVAPVGSTNQILTVLDSFKNVGWSTLITAKGDLLTIDAGSLMRLPSQEDYKVLHSDSTSSGGLAWSYVGTSAIDNLAISSSKIGSGAIASSKIVDRNITTAKILDNAIVESKISNFAVNTSALANNAISEPKIQDSAVLSEKLSASSVSSGKIQQDAVVTTKIAESAVTTNKFADNSVSAVKILDNSVSSVKIALGGVSTENIQNGAATSTKISNLSVLGSNINNLAATTQKLSDLSVSGQKVATNAVTTAVINNLAVTTGKILDLQISSSKIGDLAVVSSKIAASSVTTQKIGDLAIQSIKFANNSVENQNLRKSEPRGIIGNAANAVADPSDIVAANDNTALRRAGNFLSFGQIVTSGFEDLSVSSAKILDGSLVDRNFSGTPGIGLTKIKTGPMPSNVQTGTANYIDGSVTYSKLNFEKNNLGVGVWLDWTPTVYFSSPSSNSFPGSILSPSSYTVQHAKYMKINNLCLANLRIKIGNLSSTSASVLYVSPPLAPLNADGSVVGTSHIFNNDFNQTLFGPIGAIRNVPIIIQNLIGFSGIVEIMDLNDPRFFGIVKSSPSNLYDLMFVAGDFVFLSSISNLTIMFSIAYDVAV